MVFCHFFSVRNTMACWMTTSLGTECHLVQDSLGKGRRNAKCTRVLQFLHKTAPLQHRFHQKKNSHKTYRCYHSSQHIKKVKWKLLATGVTLTREKVGRGFRLRSGYKQLNYFLKGLSIWLLLTLLHLAKWWRAVSLSSLWLQSSGEMLTSDFISRQSQLLL